MSDKLRVGIIGLGFIGTRKHLEGLAQHKDRAEIVAFCDYEIDRAEKARAAHGSADWSERSPLDLGRVSSRDRIG